MQVNPKLLTLLEAVYDEMRSNLRRKEGAAAYKQKRHDFAFHMTDWLSDLCEWRQIVEHPDKISVDDACVSIIGILIHVIPHLNAAGRLLLDEISDSFAEVQGPSAPVKTPVPDKRKRRRKPKAKAG